MTTFPDLSLQSNVGQIAANLPGAAALFRKVGISYCRGGDLSIAEASAKSGRDSTKIIAGLRALLASVDRSVPQDTAALISHIQDRYHDTHLRELTKLIPLARKVEAVHGENPDAPRGLADHLAEILVELESHMLREEQMLFPIMLNGYHSTIADPIAVMRAEHEAHVDQLRVLEHITHGFSLPDGACRIWQAVYSGAGKFADDLVAHIYLENEVLFPRFNDAANIRVEKRPVAGYPEVLSDRGILQAHDTQPTAAPMPPHLEEMIKNSRRISGILSALAHPARLIIIRRLAAGAANFSELASLPCVAQSSLRGQLRRLRDGGLVDFACESPDGRVLTYRLCDERIIPLVDHLFDDASHQPAPNPLSPGLDGRSSRSSGRLGLQAGATT